MPHVKDPFLAAKVPVNIVLLGASSVGKTSVALQFITEKLVSSESCKPTIEDSFYKEIKLWNESEDDNDSVFKDGPTDKGVECFWKMEQDSFERKESTISLQGAGLRKGSNNNDVANSNLKMILNVTDTASYRPALSPRRSIRWHLERLTLRRRAFAASAPVGAPVRRRYRHNQETKPERSRSAVPSFIYRKNEDGASRHETLMRTADAILLVYSVKDNRSFEILKSIRDQISFVRGLHSGSPQPHSSPRKRVFSERTCSQDKHTSQLNDACRLPPIAVVGTHMDLTAPTLSPLVTKKVEEEERSSNESLLNYAFTYKSPRRPGSNGRKRFQKQISLAPEVLTEVSKPKVPEVTSEHVRGVVGAWPECIGYAEVTNNSVARVQRIFQQLTLRVLRNRISSEKKSSSPTYSPRKRFNSARNFLRRQSAIDEEDEEYYRDSSWRQRLCFCF